MSADAALSALRAATSECTATARLFSQEQSAEVVALLNVLGHIFARPSVAAATAERDGLAGTAPLLLMAERDCLARTAPLLLQLPSELTVQVLRHLDVRCLGRLACTCLKLCFGPPCPPRPRLS
jgi:hypothetical protein